MTGEETKRELEKLQVLERNLKLEAANFRMVMSSLEGAIRQDDAKTEEKTKAMLAEVEKRSYERGYENGFAEGRKQAEEQPKDDEIRVGDIVEIKETGLEIWVTSEMDDNDDEESINGLAIYDCDDTCEAGDTFYSMKKRKLKKTGKHYPMEKLLEVLRK